MQAESALAEAARNVTEGKLDEAARLCRAVLAETPDHPDALHLLGGCLLGAGEPARAAALFSRALAASPDNPLFLGNLGVALLEQGQGEPAIATLRRALSLDPAHHDARYNLGNALFAAGDIPAAAEQFAAVARAVPDYIEAHNGLALCHAQDGNLRAAAALLRNVADHAPDDLQTLTNLTRVLLQLAQPEEALRVVERALALAPDDLNLLNGRAGALIEMNRPDEAEPIVARTVAALPDDYDTLLNAANLAAKQGRTAAAESAFRAIIERFPDRPGARTNYAYLLRDRNRYAEAEAQIRETLDLAPDRVDSCLALASILAAAGRPDAAQAVYDRALARHPDHEELLKGRGALAYAHGRFAAGAGDLFRARAAKGRRPDLSCPVPFPPSLDGRTIVVARDQGLGDELCFLRFMPALTARGAKTRYIADPRLVAMLRRAGIADEIAAWRGTAEQLAGLAVVDLPHALGLADGASLPPPIRIPALSDVTAAMRRRLAECGAAPFIGVTWRGGIAGRRGTLFKEAPLAALAAALRGMGGTFIALQRLPAAGEVAEFARLLEAPLHDLTALNDDLEAMLALTGLLDEYVCVSNTNVHLRAAQGRTCRVLTPHPAEYRWMAEGGESPWFPGSAVYRQRRDGDWSAALAALARDLRTPR